MYVARVAWLIQYQSGSYRFARGEAGATLGEVAVADPSDTSELITSLATAGYAGQPALLAIPSQWCLSAQVVLSSRRMMRNRQAVAYAIEERLPLSAEEMVCDYIAVGGDTFGVAADTSRLLPIVQSLEQNGVSLVSVTPSALLLLQRCIRVRVLPASGLVLFPQPDGCDCFVVSGAHPRLWYYLPPDASEANREMAAVLLAQGDESFTSATVVAAEEKFYAELLHSQSDIALIHKEFDHDQGLLEAARDVLSGSDPPWIELRRGPIGEFDPLGPVRGSIRFLVVAFLIACLSLASAAWIRASKYDRWIRVFEDEKRRVFQDLFPEAHVPTGIRSRLESERRRLLGSSAGFAEFPEMRSVTGDLVEALDAFPPDLRFRLLEVRIERQALYFEGEVRRHGDVDLIASSLRSRGFMVEPPRTEQRDAEGVSFALRVTAPAIGDGAR